MQRGRGSIKGRKRHWHRKTERKREKGELVTKQVRTKENHSKVTAVLTATYVVRAVRNFMLSSQYLYGVKSWCYSHFIEEII